MTMQSQAFGLDLSDLVIRAVQFGGQGKNIAVRGFGQINLQPGIISGGDVMEPKALSEAVKNLVSHPQTGHISGKRVVASLPDSRSFVKVIEIPQVEDHQRQETIQWELAQHLPLAMDELYLDWQTIDGSNGNRVVACAVPKTVADSYVTSLEEAGLQPIGLIVEPLAIAYSLLPVHQNLETDVLLIDLGHTRTSFIVSDHGVVTFSLTKTDFSGQLMTQTIAKGLNLTDTEAEEAKILCGLDPERGQAALPKLLWPMIEALSQHIQSILTYYQSHNQGHHLSEIILVGGGAHLRNLVPELSNKVGLPVKLGNPFTQIEHIGQHRAFPMERHLSLPTVIGLGLIANSAKFKAEI